MKDLELELYVNGEKKIFRPMFLSGLVVRKAFDTVKTIQSGNVGEDVKLDKAVEYICLVYGNKFTIEEFYNGISAEGMMEKILGIITKVMDKANGTIKNSNCPTPKTHNNKNRR